MRRRVWILTWLMMAIELVSAGTGKPKGPREPDVPEVFRCRVARVVEGDRLEVIRRGKKLIVRLRGADCPEPGQPYRLAARLYVMEKCVGREIAVRAYERSDEGVVTADVALKDRSLLSERLVRLGLAWHVKEQGEDDVVCQLEAEARKAKRGIWSRPDPVAPWVYRGTGRKPEKKAAKEIPKCKKVERAPACAPVAIELVPQHRQEPAEAGEGRVYVTQSGKKYHRKGCRHLRKSRTAVTLQEALEHGYRPCKVCKPRSVAAAADKGGGSGKGEQ